MSQQDEDKAVHEYILQKTHLSAKVIDKYFNDDPDNKDIGFILLVFPIGEDQGRCNYVSNKVPRENAKRILEAQAKRL